MTKIALVVPRTPRLARRPALRRLWEDNARFRESSFFFPLPNLALLTLAAHTPDSWEVKYLDENVEDVDLDENCRIAAITAMTCQAPRAYRLAAAFRRRGTHVVLGGIHPTILPRETLRHADTVICGEGEDSWVEFLSDFNEGRPRRLYRPRKRYFSLGRSKAPRFDIVPFDKYRAMPLQIGRGCPMKCEFCSVETIYGPRYRHKSVAQVVDEIAALRKCWPGPRPRVFFTDDNLHLRPRFLAELAAALRSQRINWMAQMDVAVGRHPELLRLMSESGCSQLLIGFESLEPGNLERMQPGGVKPRHLPEYGRLVRAIQSQGIRVLGMFIVGLDEDRPDVFRRLRDFIDENVLHDAQVTIQTPLPGTKLFGRLKRQGRLFEPLDWSQCNFFNVLYRPRHLTPLQLARGQTWLYQQIHHPRLLARRQKYWLDHYRSRDAGSPPAPARE